MAREDAGEMPVDEAAFRAMGLLGKSPEEYALEIQQKAPSVSIEQAREMYRLRIKARKDGTFGFKLKCAREGCSNHPDKCYCEPTVEQAIQAVTTRRSDTYCGVSCSLVEDQGLNDAAWDAISYNATQGTTLERALPGLLAKSLGLPEGSARPSWPWLAPPDMVLDYAKPPYATLRDAHPDWKFPEADLRDLALQALDDERENWDHDVEPDQGECACDVDGDA